MSRQDLPSAACKHEAASLMLNQGYSCPEGAKFLGR
jgi:hypothetical protein